MPYLLYLAYAGLLSLLQNVLQDFNSRKAQRDEVMDKAEKLQDEANNENDKQLIKDKGKLVVTMCSCLVFTALCGTFYSHAD